MSQSYGDLVWTVVDRNMLLSLTASELGLRKSNRRKERWQICSVTALALESPQPHSLQAILFISTEDMLISVPHMNSLLSSSKQYSQHPGIWQVTDATPASITRKAECTVEEERSEKGKYILASKRTDH
ncbi:Adamts-Like Protein 4 [Manis pentadactyla]|nr:Adamts-Like Protein 4 [Manis pentadactyla]